MLRFKEVSLFALSLSILAGCAEEASEPQAAAAPPAGSRIAPLDVSAVKAEIQVAHRTEGEDDSNGPPAPADEDASQMDPKSPNPENQGSEIKEFWVAATDHYPRILARGEFRNGNLNGKCTGKTESGHLYFVEPYKNGLMHGTKTQYYPSGAKYMDLECTNGVPNGQNRIYYEDGTVASIITFKNGVLHGQHATYFPNGSPCVEAENVNGQAEGLRRHYLPSGRRSGTTHWREGRQVDQAVIVEPTQRDLLAMERVADTMNFKKIWAGFLRGLPAQSPPETDERPAPSPRSAYTDSVPEEVEIARRIYSDAKRQYEAEMAMYEAQLEYADQKSATTVIKGGYPGFLTPEPPNPYSKLDMMRAKRDYEEALQRYGLQ